MKRLLAALFMLAGVIPASASDCWNNTAGTQTNCAVVITFLNSSNQTVPLSPSNPFPLPANAALEAGGNLAALLAGTNTLITAVQSPIPAQAGTVIIGGTAIDQTAQGVNNAVVSIDPPGRVYQDVSSGTKANAVANAAISATATTKAYLCGFELTATGATAGLAADVTLTGVATNLGTMHFAFSFPAGATVGAYPLVVKFVPCRVSYAVNTSIQVSLPASGAGGTNATANIHGYNQ